MLTTFSFGVSSNLSQQKSLTAQIVGPEKIYAYNFRCWLFGCDKFEETPNEKVVNMSKLTESYFKGSAKFRPVKSKCCYCTVKQYYHYLMSPTQYKEVILMC